MAHAFIDGLAVGAAAALLSNSKKPSYHSTNYPLSKEQAELYMGTPEYGHYLTILLTNSIYIHEGYGFNPFKPFPWVHSITNESHWWPSRTEVRRYTDELRQQFREKHIVVLQTGGIGSLPRNMGNWTKTDTCDKVCCVFTLILSPLLILSGLCCEENLWMVGRFGCVETVEDDPYYSKLFGYVKADIFDQETGKYCKTIKKLAMLKLDYTRFLDKHARSEDR